ncbi:MAG TPA: RluA family pseudouridine synthase [Planctomycetota bacterium]
MSQSQLQRAVVPAGLHGERLDRAASALFDGPWSRSRLAHWIRDGRMTLAGLVTSKPGAPVEAGQELVLDVPVAEPMDEESGLEPVIVYQDESLAVLSKPSGLLMHGRFRGDPRASVARWLAERFGSGLPTAQGAERPGIVHRLDSETSGVCVVAFDEVVFIDLMEQFAARTVEKTYRALVYGKPRFESDWIERSLARDARNPSRVRALRPGAGGPGVRDALTFWKVKERFEGFADIEAQPRTGRTHQIRVHLASIDLPILGDPIYKARNYGPGLLPPGAPPLTRTQLHAERLSFEHPTKGERVEFTAPLADDFAAIRAFLAATLPAPEQGWA